MQIVLSGAQYGGYIVLGNIATLYDVEGNIVDEKQVVTTSTEITIENHVYTIVDTQAVFTTIV
jgi:hypothetical protein